MYPKIGVKVERGPVNNCFKNVKENDLKIKY